VFALRAWATANPQPQPVSVPTPATRLSFTDAAEQVLDKYASKSPMHYRAITDKALELGLIATAGKTPEATLYAQIITEIQRRTKRGERPRFVRYGKGVVGLSKWKGTGLAFQIDQHNQQVRRKLIQQIGKMPPAEFEALVGTLLAKLGFEDVTVTSFKGDGGIDVRGTMVTGDVVRTRMAVQVKRWKANVQAPTVQQVRGSLGAHEQGLIITTSDFSKGASAEAERADATPVALMNGEQLVKLLVENDIGIRRTGYDLIEPGWDENV
jgi:restriction system protein